MGNRPIGVLSVYNIFHFYKGYYEYLSHILVEFGKSVRY